MIKSKNIPSKFLALRKSLPQTKTINDEDSGH